MSEQSPTSNENNGGSDTDTRVAEPTVDQLKLALADAEQRAAANHDQFVRAAAELDNFRKRAARDVENARKFSLESFAGELLQVRDSLELGLAAADGAESPAGALREGTEMTLRLMEQVMAKFGIEQVDPLGEPFDPTLHEAIVMIEADAEPGSVVEVVQKGYRINERLLRAARVVVAKAADTESSGSG